MVLTESQLIAFIKEGLQVEETLDAESRLFSTGVLDSVAMLQLITFVEEKAGFEIRPQDVTLENFDTVGSIVRFAEGQS
jgi:acyl carrier protein